MRAGGGGILDDDNRGSRQSNCWDVGWMDFGWRAGSRWREADVRIGLRHGIQMIPPGSAQVLLHKPSALLCSRPDQHQSAPPSDDASVSQQDGSELCYAIFSAHRRHVSHKGPSCTGTGLQCATLGIEPDSDPAGAHLP